MKISTDDRIERHQAFLERRNTDRPLIGCIRGWENLSRYTSNTEAFFPKGIVAIDDLSCEQFLSMYQEYAAMLDEPDDLFRTIEPLSFFPWTEAAMGCAINYTGKNFWSSPFDESLLSKMIDENHQSNAPERISGTIELDHMPQNIHEKIQPWLVKYSEFIDFLTAHFGDRYPIGQSILRGPLDMIAALFGDENMLYQFYDQPSLVKKLLALTSTIFMQFIDIQRDHLQPFYSGGVIGTYYIWTPGNCIRLQEDAMAMLSPQLYREFVHPYDCAIASSADYCLFHLHATGLHLLDIILENESVNIIQISKDEGVELESIIPDLRKVQQAERCLLLKGRFNQKEIYMIQNLLEAYGLCVQAVVLNEKEADEFYSTIGLR